MTADMATGDRVTAASKNARILELFDHMFWDGPVLLRIRHRHTEQKEAFSCAVSAYPASAPCLPACSSFAHIHLERKRWSKWSWSFASAEKLRWNKNLAEYRVLKDRTKVKDNLKTHIPIEKMRNMPRNSSFLLLRSMFLLNRILNRLKWLGFAIIRHPFRYTLYQKWCPIMKMVVSTV